MGRKIEKGALFLDDKDREDFMKRLAGLAESKTIALYGWHCFPIIFICCVKQKSGHYLLPCEN